MRSASNNSFLMPIRITHDSTVVEKKHLTYFLFIWVKYPNGQIYNRLRIGLAGTKSFFFCSWL